MRHRARVPDRTQDSFLVANAGYVAEQTGSPAAEIVLLRASADPAALAARAQAPLDRCPRQVRDLGATPHTINSSLTAVDLGGLPPLELAFAVLLIAAAAGLVLGLSLAERQRTFAHPGCAWGAHSTAGSFVWSEGLLVFVGGSLVGILLGFGIAQMLVVLLTGVFDPPARRPSPCRGRM